MKKLREKLNAKLRKNGGFTMVEMLIVVAIIAILMAVSIPMFQNALEKARHGVDAANLRSAISLANAEAIASLDPATEFKNPVTYWYLVDKTGDRQGALSTTEDTSKTVAPQCTSATTDNVLKVKITYNPSSSDPLEVFKIETNWTINSSTGHITADENP